MARFDLRALFEAVDAKRKQSGLSWSGLGREVGVSAATIRRFRDARDAEADGVLALLRWLDAVPENYVTGGSVKGDRLSFAGNGYVRVDMERVARANDHARGAQGRTRTTIQRLVESAQRSGQPVASLTRLSRT